MLIPDNRDEFRQYDRAEPFFGAAPTALLEGLAQRSDLELHVISCSRVKMPAPARLAPNIHFHLLYVPRGESLRSLYFGCVVAIRRQLRELEPDVVHGQGTERYCALAAVCSGLPNVVTLHGIMRGMARATHARIGSFYWCNAVLESFTLRRTSGVLCNSAYTEEMVHSRTVRTWRVPNALRSLFFSPKPSSPRNTTPILLNIGTVEPHKQQIAILQLAQVLFKAGHRFQVHFVGTILPNDAYGCEFQQRLERAVADGFARYFEPQSDAELLACFDAADALIHFSREESFGLVVAEALARNLKLFASEIGGIRDIAAGVEMAELFDIEDWAGLSAAVARWIGDGFPQPTLAAREMEARYCPTHVAAAHMDIYGEIFATARR